MYNLVGMRPAIADSIEQVRSQSLIALSSVLLHRLDPWPLDNSFQWRNVRIKHEAGLRFGLDRGPRNAASDQEGFDCCCCAVS